MNHQKFNDAIANAFDEKDPEIRNWLSTQHGRMFSGISNTEPIDGICLSCGEKGQIATRRRNSSYANDESNWMTSCENCFQEDYEQLCEDWETYYSMTM